jgi:integrase
MACVRKRRGKWVLDFRDQHGKRHWQTFATRREADAGLIRIGGAIARNEYQASAEQLTFAELAKVFDSAHIALKRESTAAGYRTIVVRHLEPYFGPIKLRRITPQVVEAFRTTLAEKLSTENATRPRTVNKALVMLGLMLRYAERHAWIATNPVRHVERLRVTPRTIEPLAPDGVAQLLEHALDPWRPILATAAMTGARQGEVLALRWPDVDLTARRITIKRSFTDGRLSEPKTAAGTRTVDIPETLAAILRVWKLKCPKTALGLCFPSPKETLKNPSLRHPDESMNVESVWDDGAKRR